MCDLPEGMHGLLCALSFFPWPPGARGARINSVLTCPLMPPFPCLLPPVQAVTGMVYSNANPSWPSNGNGNAFVLPVRRSKRQTDLVITVWDGSESLEEAIPVGKVHVNLQEYMQFPVLPPGKDTPDDPPPSEYLNRVRHAKAWAVALGAGVLHMAECLRGGMVGMSVLPAHIIALPQRDHVFHVCLLQGMPLRSILFPASAQSARLPRD